jgi:DNA-nicking Smr family endonuclease
MADKKHNNSKNVSDEDAALFRSEVKGATPVKSDRVVHEKPAVKPGKISANNIENQELQTGHEIDDNFDLNPVDANTSLFFSHPGLQHKEIKRLKRGENGIEAGLDLHGCTTTQAKQKLLQFVAQSQQSGKRCVLLIHGRGLGANSGRAVLKSAINHWLPQMPSVMAFCSALTKDGGLGAVYVLLRKG